MMSTRPVARVCAVLATTLALSVSLPMAAGASQPAGPSWPGGGAQDAAPSHPSSEPRLEPVPGAQPPASGMSRRSSAFAASVPGPVTGLSATVDSSSSVRLTWTGPSDGSVVSGYLIEITDPVATYELDWNDTTTTVRITGLDPDTSYSVRIAAKNDAGVGEFSEAVEFVTPFLYVERQAGANRFATAARVAERTFGSVTLEGAFLVNGMNFPDALTAAAAGGAAAGPVLLTTATELPAETREQLDFLRPQLLVVAGGFGVVSQRVEDEAATSGASEPVRLAAATRFGTAARVAEMWDEADTVYLASGMNFPDALAGAAAAGYNGYPVLLAQPTNLPTETAAALSRLKPTRIVVLGGTGVVSKRVADAAAAATGVATSVERLAGTDRYDTAIAISKATFPTPGVPVAFVASGLGFADALAGAAAAGYLGGPVLLTAPGSASPALLTEVDRLRPERIVVLGGPSAVSDRVMAQLDATRG